ncbi:hypothetical protein Esti_005607 [Eimeria stiedai]
MRPYWRHRASSLQPYVLAVRDPYRHMTAWIGRRKLSGVDLFQDATFSQFKSNHWTCYLQRRLFQSDRSKTGRLDEKSRRIGSLREILHSVGLQSYAACENAWSYLGAVGALKLKEGPRTEQLYGPSRRRLIFVINNSEVAQAWSQAVEEVHSTRDPLLLALDLEWASFLRAAHRPGGCGNNIRDADASRSKRDATEICGSDFAGDVSDSFQLSLLQLCVEKQGHRDAWPPSCSVTKGSCSFRDPAADFAFAGDADTPLATEPQRTKGITPIDLATAIEAAFDIGSVCLFDSSKASEDIMRHLRRLLEHPTLPKIVHDCREDGAILFANFGVKLKGVFDTMVAANVLQRSRGTEVFQRSLNDMLLENLGVVNPRKEQAAALLREDSNVWNLRPLPKVLMEYAVYDVLHLPALSRVLRSNMSSAQEVECSNWSSLNANYCDLNRGGASHAAFGITGEAGDVTCPASPRRTSANASQQSGAAAPLPALPRADGGCSRASRGAGFPSVRAAPGDRIQGLVAAVGPKFILLKVNVGDPRVVALADSAEASVCLHRSPLVGDTLNLLVKGRHPRTKALLVSALPPEEEHLSHARKSGENPKISIAIHQNGPISCGKKQ